MNLLRKLPIRGQMYLIAALTVSVIIVILLFNYSRSAAYLTKNNEMYTRDISSQLEQTILSNYDVIKWMTYNVAYNQSIQDYLLDEDKLSKYQRFPTLKNLFINLSTVKSGILDFIVSGKNGDWFSLQGYSTEQFGNFMPKRADSYFSNVKECPSGSIMRYCFAVGTNIFSSNIHKRYTSEIGQIIVLIDATTLTGGYDLKTLQPGTAVYLLDRGNTIFMSNEREKIGQPFELPKDEVKSGLVRIDGKLNHIQIKDIPQIGGKFVRVIPDDVFFQDIRKLRKQTLIAVGIGVLLLMIPFLFILNNMILPLRKLYYYMRINHQDDLNKRVDLSGSAEAEVIGTRYNQMLSNVQDLTDQLVDSKERLLTSEIEKKRAEYDFLKSQVNPHFLYNTLDTIRGLASERGVPEIREMTGALSRIFRYSIKGNDVVPLSQEIRIVEAYMNIQAIRFSHRFELSCHVPGELMQLKVPKMILQPIIENAVYHGLEPRYEKGKLTVTAMLDESGQDLIITIQDDGVGMNEEQLACIRKQLDLSREAAAASEEGSHGVGLTNVHNRLQYLFEHPYGIEIWSKEKAGTTVTLRIPVQMEMNEHV
ncbi:two-component system sensor histidine kinase YesM [Paenibacillus taihuensis]|uniref:Two-component system sensor histidine kinase YesM n=1 Tax=Paenibacillus taihuensis TaxID=1156355 RepID=A0A3D9RZ36_9BACL|nr:sensor histidine kinase [Paenibacillus taihuensis]REE85328.1 two-component system sensor histidine kinase YesM [Paenibacillus taihuensis]